MFSFLFGLRETATLPLYRFGILQVFLPFPLALTGDGCYIEVVITAPPVVYIFQTAYYDYETEEVEVLLPGWLIRTWTDFTTVTAHVKYASDLRAPLTTQPVPLFKLRIFQLDLMQNHPQLFVPLQATLCQLPLHYSPSAESRFIPASCLPKGMHLSLREWGLERVKYEIKLDPSLFSLFGC
jgi:hypothetical protein